MRSCIGADVGVAIEERGVDQRPGTVRLVGRVDDGGRHRGHEFLHVALMNLASGWRLGRRRARRHRPARAWETAAALRRRSRPLRRRRFARPRPRAGRAESCRPTADRAGECVPSSGGCVANRLVRPSAKYMWLASAARGLMSLRAEHGRADSLERAGDSVRIARELHGRGVGQELALPRDGRLDEVAEEQADEAEHHERQADDEQRIRRRCSCRDRLLRHRRKTRLATARGRRGPSARMPCSMPISRRLSRMSPLRMWLNSWAMTPCSSSRVSCSAQPRVTPITASLGEKPAAKALMPCSSVEHEHRRHGHARGEGHFLDDVQQPAFGRIGRVRIDAPAAEPLGDDRAAAGELSDLEQAAAADERERDQHSRQRALRAEFASATGMRRSAIAVTTNVVPTMPIDGQHEHHDQPLRIAAGDDPDVRKSQWPWQFRLPQRHREHGGEWKTSIARLRSVASAFLDCSLSNPNRRLASPSIRSSSKLTLCLVLCGESFPLS